MADPTSADRGRSEPLTLVPIGDRERPGAPLPTPLTSFVGRERELEQVCALLRRDDVRLVTLTGPGGVGKTRLAIRAAEEVDAEFADGVAFVDLTPLASPDLVALTIAQALGVREAGDRPVAERLVDALRDRARLLVLDNFERIVDASPLIAGLLAACPGVTALATSREPLRLSAERVVAVPPLALPDPARSAEELAAADVVRLFVDRAEAARADFAITDQNAAEVAEVCRRLDGLPLAIELAAAHANVLPPAALLARLERRLPLLTGGPLDAPARLRTMRSAIAWSHDLLSEEEQSLFRRLAVFVGGCTLEAAEAVGSGGDSAPATSSVLDGVAALVGKSLWRQEEGHVSGGLGGAPRYVMLETVREFALERLAASGEEARTRQRHANHFCAVVEAATASPPWPAPAALVRLLDAERDNLRAALAWLDRVGDHGRFLRLATLLFPLWYPRGLWGEGRRWLERGLAHGDAVPANLRAPALGLAGMLASYQGDNERARQLLEEGLALDPTVLDPTPDERLSATYRLRQLALVLLHQGRYAEAIPHFAESLARFRNLGSEANSAFSHIGLGMAAYGQGDLSRARTECEAALAVARSTGSAWFGSAALACLGLVACARRDDPGAAAAFAEALAHADAAGNLVAGTTTLLAGVAELAIGRGAPETAARLLGSAEVQAEQLGTPFWLPERLAFERATAAARAALGKEAFAAAWAAGQILAPAAAVAEAQAFLATVEPAPAEVGHPAGLTPREAEVLRLLARPYSNPEIAEVLSVSPRTIQTHVAHILAKLGVANRREAAAAADRLGLR